MSLDDITLGDIKQLRVILGLDKVAVPTTAIDNKMIGKYVIVRCSSAGIHAGVLESHNGRECVLTESRRLWYWKPANKKSYLSGVAVAGLDSSSKVGASLPRLHLTEDCEIIECLPVAEKSIRELADHDQ